MMRGWDGRDGGFLCSLCRLEMKQEHDIRTLPYDLFGLVYVRHIIMCSRFSICVCVVYACPR